MIIGTLELVTCYDILIPTVIVSLIGHFRAIHLSNFMVLLLFSVFCSPDMVEYTVCTPMIYIQTRNNTVVDYHCLLNKLHFRTLRNIFFFPYSTPFLTSTSLFIATDPMTSER